VCRHVVEHIDRIGDFLTMLAESARCTGASQVMIETPDFGWIAASGAFWDIFHEHRNYFGREALAGLCRQAGFRVDAHCATFQGQYQNLLLTPQPGPPPTPQPESISPTCRLAAFARATAEKIRTVSATVEDARAGGRWAIWGAGAKGVSLANHLQHAAGMVPAIVFDINPAKQGSFLPGHGTPICAPEGELLRSVSLVVVANPAYGVEIKRTIAEAGAKSTRLFLLR
ncbi:MAG: hypothetical protein HN849_24620, partial [Victivallales bacterium]|nr:hypothetical protein [Victivallales bacterium]